jgi:hypothetical protein
MLNIDSMLNWWLPGIHGIASKDQTEIFSASFELIDCFGPLKLQLSSSATMASPGSLIGVERG